MIVREAQSRKAVKKIQHKHLQTCLLCAAARIFTFKLNTELGATGGITRYPATYKFDNAAPSNELEPAFASSVAVMSVLDIDTFLATQALSEAAQSEPDITRELEAGDSLPSSSPSPHGTPPPAQAQRLAAEDTFSTISTVTAHSRGVSVVSSSAGSTGRKRAGEDLSMLVQRTARKAKLKADGELTLSKFTKLTPVHRELTIMASLIRMQEKLDEIQPREVAWKLPAKLYNKIEVLSADILLYAHISSYQKPATKLLLDILEHNPNWGFSKDVKFNQNKYDVVTDRAQNRLTDRRNYIKNTIKTSIGQENPHGADKPRLDSRNVIQLIEDVIAALYKPPRTADIRITVPIVRCTEKKVVRYTGKKVDATLEKIRTMMADHPKTTVSTYFKQILVADLRMYGEVDLDELVEINETKSQVEIDAVFNGTAGEPNDDSDSEDN
ncbi:hypothetical protein EW026_g5709 [Hermanssonia centrifuga]|uniref:Uncharacterized protein n=1 Tax=Hermanssonia centrifuga TaxID=98765 RepID=A0A4S4KHN5_9APHY|nr:hypothetical protein EW026_g5709 [Hermanssonia centrifuga]